MKIGIVGAGMVGATAAYAMIMRGIGREIILLDRNMQRAQAEADDLLHAVPFAPHSIQVRAGDYPELNEALNCLSGTHDTRRKNFRFRVTVHRTRVLCCIEHGFRFPWIAAQRLGADLVLSSA